MSAPSPKRRSGRLIDDERKVCPDCGYNLTGHLAADINRCPECGRTFKYSDLLDYSAPDPDAPDAAQGPGAWWYWPAMALWVVSPAFLVGIARAWSGLAILETAALGSAPLVLYGWAWVLLEGTDVRRRWLTAFFPAVPACAGNAAVLGLFGAFGPHGTAVFMVALATASATGLAYFVVHLTRR